MEVAAKLAAFPVPVRTRPYRSIMTRRPSSAILLSATDLTQQLRWCGGAVVASAKQQRRRNRAAEKEEAGKEIGGVGQAVLAALKSEVPQPNNSRISSKPEGKDERRSPGGDEEGGRTETTLSGSDVLLALQRTAETGRGKGRRKRRKNERRGVREEDTMDYSSVRPLSINRDWGARLDDMERRLQELLQL